jgi:hypothetical protein
MADAYRRALGNGSVAVQMLKVPSAPSVLLCTSRTDTDAGNAVEPPTA